MKDVSQSDSTDNATSQPGDFSDATYLLHSGPAPSRQQGVLNPPIYRASTIIYDDVDSYVDRRSRFFDGVMYGLYGTPTTQALADAISHLEGGTGTVITGSGTAAIACALGAFVGAGDHIIVADTVYGQTRNYCEEILTRFGVEISYFAPDQLDRLEAMIKPTSKLIFLESPGSQTFEMIDVPQIVTLADKHGLLTAIDNTWATPLFYKPLREGVDISIQSGTKYLSGHSDVMLGSISANNRPLFEQLKKTAGSNGHMASPDDCYLVHRGMRSLDIRMARHQENAQILMTWLAQQPEVCRILSPAWKDDSGHAIWMRDFSGASGLFGVAFHKHHATRLPLLIDSLQLFRIGSSWGGYESLVVPVYPKPARHYPSDRLENPVIRFHGGLEAPEDLIRDLEKAFHVLRNSSGSE